MTDTQQPIDTDVDGLRRFDLKRECRWCSYWDAIQDYIGAPKERGYCTFNAVGPEGFPVVGWDRTCGDWDAELPRINEALTDQTANEEQSLKWSFARYCVDPDEEILGQKFDISGWCKIQVWGMKRVDYWGPSGVFDLQEPKERPTHNVGVSLRSVARDLGIPVCSEGPLTPLGAECAGEYAPWLLHNSNGTALT